MECFAGICISKNKKIPLEQTIENLKKEGVFYKGGNKWFFENKPYVTKLIKIKRIISKSPNKIENHRLWEFNNFSNKKFQVWSIDYEKIHPLTKWEDL